MSLGGSAPVAGVGDGPLNFLRPRHPSSLDSRMSSGPDLSFGDAPFPSSFGTIQPKDMEPQTEEKKENFQKGRSTRSLPYEIGSLVETLSPLIS